VLNDDDVASHVTELPNGLRLQRGQSVVIARHADRALFVSTWGPLATALFVDADLSNFGVPIVNGDERFVLSKGDAVLDGPAAAGSVHHCYQRSGADASAASSWEEVAIADGTPGSAASVAGRGGLTITEWCDADTPALEFIELTLL
jgi:hypothetical protein